MRRRYNPLTAMSLPNVLLAMRGDVGLGAPSSFGGVFPTPLLDRIGAEELRYTSFHSTGEIGVHASVTSPAAAKLQIATDFRNTSEERALDRRKRRPRSIDERWPT